MTEPPVVMLGGDGSTLSVTRSLARAGVDVHVLGNRSSLVRHSRFCARFVDLGVGDGMQDRWLEWLEHGPRGAVILTCHDDGLELVARHRHRLLELGYRPFEADDDILLAMLDKSRTYELAAKVGVAAPRTWAAGTRKDLDEAASEVTYPCALKPRHSHLFARLGREKLLMAGDESELRDAFELCHTAGAQMLVTEIVPGRDDQHFSYYTYLDENGEPLFHLTKQKLRQYPVGHGGGTCHITDWNPEVAELGLRYVQGIGLRGMANPEFKRDPRDGQLKLIEVNHRFTMINELVRAAGIDLAVLAYNRVVGRPVPEMDGYRRGSVIWFPWSDFSAFRVHRSRGELSFGGWLRTLAHRQCPPYFAWDDPRPSLTCGKRWFLARGRLLRAIVLRKRAARPS